MLTQSQYPSKGPCQGFSHPSRRRVMPRAEGLVLKHLQTRLSTGVTKKEGSVWLERLESAWRVLSRSSR
jgi:hypothetical protein